jgi:hypothetical protein
VYRSLSSHGDPTTRKPGSPAMRCICCGRICTLASLTGHARSRPFGATWMHAECGSGRPKGPEQKPKGFAQRSLRRFDRDQPPPLAGDRDLHPNKSHWPWQPMPGPTMTNDLPEGACFPSIGSRPTRSRSISKAMQAEDKPDGPSRASNRDLGQLIAG